MTGVIVVAVLVGLAMSVKCTSATFYIVGEGTCSEPYTWNSECDCTSWALSHDFAVGDTLDFEFDESSNTVAEATETGYSECSPSTTLANPPPLQTRSPFTLDLTEATNYYFVSMAADGSCNQKLLITVAEGNQNLVLHRQLLLGSTAPPAPPPSIASSGDSPPPFPRFHFPSPPPPRYYFILPPPRAYLPRKQPPPDYSLPLYAKLLLGVGTGVAVPFVIFIIKYIKYLREMKEREAQQL